MAIVSEEADESVFWLKRMVNANIRSTTEPIEPLLAEAEELAGSSARRIERPSVAAAAAAIGNDQMQCPNDSMMIR
jgi:hypothetical protein